MIHIFSQVIATGVGSEVGKVNCFCLWEVSFSYVDSRWQDTLARFLGDIFLTCRRPADVFETMWTKSVAFGPVSLFQKVPIHIHVHQFSK